MDFESDDVEQSVREFLEGILLWYMIERKLLISTAVSHCVKNQAFSANVTGMSSMRFSILQNFYLFQRLSPRRQAWLPRIINSWESIWEVTTVGILYNRMHFNLLRIAFRLQNLGAMVCVRQWQLRMKHSPTGQSLVKLQPTKSAMRKMKFVREPDRLSIHPKLLFTDHRSFILVTIERPWPSLPELLREFSIQALFWQPAKRKNIPFASFRFRLLRAVATGIPHWPSFQPRCKLEVATSSNPEDKDNTQSADGKHPT